ncbi:MAG TPA: hypothetical protein VFY12_09550 [Arenimonas sp.]|nr:hypothetical protein [Arenimonas sp.]
MSEHDHRQTAKAGGLYAELKRRNVFRVAAAYIVIGWLSLQVADVVLGFTGAPDWVGKTLIALLLLGFVPALGLAWVFEVDRNGVHLDHGDAHAADPATHGNRLDTLTLIAVFGVVLLMAWQHLGPGFPRERKRPSASSEAAPAAADAADSASSSLQPMPGSIAVLPFTNRSAEPDTAFFVDGVHDDLLTELSRNAALTVISRTSMLEYRDTTKNLRQIGEELGVAHVLEGAVQRAGQRVRINAQLIDARSDKHLWAETFDRELTPESIFEIQSEIAGAIATALNRKLGVAMAANAAPAGEAPTRNAAAYEFYLRARADRDNWAQEAIEARIALYQQAVDADPQFALAMAELGREYANRFWYQTRSDEDRVASRQWIDRALTLRPDDPQIRLALAEHYYRAELDWASALAELDRAEQGLPGSAELMALRGYIHRRAGNAEASLAALLRSARLDPRSWVTAQTLCELYLLLGRVEEARHWATIVRDLPQVPEAYRRAFLENLLSARTGDAAPLLAEVDRLRALTLPTTSEEVSTVFGLEGAYRARDWTRMDAYMASAKSEQFETQFRLHTLADLRARKARAQGDAQATRRHAEQAVTQIEARLANGLDDYRAWMALARVKALLGDAQAARAAITKAQAHPTLTRDTLIHSEVMREVALVLAIFADSEEVAAALDAYLALPLRYWSYAGLIVLPEFDRHREHPAMRALSRKYADESAAP